MVKYRNPWLVVVFYVISLGFYSIYWLVSTSRELRGLNCKAPSGYHLLVTIILMPIATMIIAIIGAVLTSQGLAGEVFGIIVLIIAGLMFILGLLLVCGYYMDYTDAICRISPSDCDLWAVFFVLSPLAMWIAQRHLNKIARPTDHLRLA